MEIILNYITIVAFIIFIHGCYHRGNLGIKKIRKIKIIPTKLIRQNNKEYYLFKLSFLWLVVFYYKTIKQFIFTYIN